MVSSAARQIDSVREDGFAPKRMVSSGGYFVAFSNYATGNSYQIPYIVDNTHYRQRDMHPNINSEYLQWVRPTQVVSLNPVELTESRLGLSQIIIHHDSYTNLFGRDPQRELPFTDVADKNHGIVANTISVDLQSQFAVDDKFTPTTSDSLSEIMLDLESATEEANGEGFPIPSQVALYNARRLIRGMYRILPRRFEVYPTPDGEIAIDLPTGRGSSVIVLCDSEGGALCLVNIRGAHRRRRYGATSALPDDFMRDALSEIEREIS